MNRTIIRSSDKFKKDILKKKKLTEIVNGYLYSLNSAIENAHKNNKISVILALPIGFNIPEHINYKNFQTEVYYNIVEILQSKGYFVKIKLKEEESYLIVSWNLEDDANINLMKQKLKSVMI
jgi:phospholipid N-methyltransferase